MLLSAGVEQNVIDRGGMTLTQDAMARMAQTFGVSEHEVKGMLDSLRADRLSEDADRFTYEADILGNVTIRDTRSGAKRDLVGSEAFGLMAEIERVGIHYQAVIAPYFTLVESDEFDAMDEEMATSGTYNFPADGYLVTVQYGIRDEKPFLSVERVIVADTGDEVVITDKMRDSFETLAREWIDKI